MILAACKPKAPERVPVPLTEDTTFLTGTIYLVRHAEQHPGEDSDLTKEGHARAGALYHMLKDSGLNKIYITRFKRSLQTADSLRLYKHIDTCYYMADTTGESLIYEISRHQDWGKRLLVVGHSNTLIPIMRSLRARPPVDSIGATEYDRLFIIRKYRDSVSLRQLRIL